MKGVGWGLFTALCAVGLVWGAVTPARVAHAPETPAEKMRRFTQFGRYTNEVRQVFHSRTIERRLLFTIDVSKAYFDALFGDLPYAVVMANQHAGKKYQITPNGDHYDAYDGLKTWAKIYELERDLQGGSLSFYIKGTYKGSMKLVGSMVMDVKYSVQGSNTFFFITAFVSIDDPFLREMAQFLSNFKGFRDMTDRIVEGTIGEIRRVGFVTARALNRLGPAVTPPEKTPGLVFTK